MSDIETDPETLSTNGAQICLRSLKAHWAEAQIDGPLQTIARYDDVAKLLITIGGFLLAVLAAGYSQMFREHTPPIDISRMRTISIVVFASMLIFFVCAAAVCLPQPIRLAGTILLLKTDHELEKLIEKWCANISRVILIKRVLLGLSTLFFIASFLLMVFLVLNLMG